MLITCWRIIYFDTSAIPNKFFHRKGIESNPHQLGLAIVMCAAIAHVWNLAPPGKILDFVSSVALAKEEARLLVNKMLASSHFLLLGRI